MKILLSSQIREADVYTIQHEPIASIDLMERASTAFVNCFTAHYANNKKAIVLAGPGNNGGDGLAIARLLTAKGWHVEVFTVGDGAKTSGDFRTNLARWLEIKPVKEIRVSGDIPAFGPDAIVIDAMFGSGLTRPVEGIFAETIHAVNRARPVVVAVDIASGLFSDRHTEGSAIMRVDSVISFQTPKLAFFMRENFPYVGKWFVADIGLNKAFIESLRTPYQTIEKSWIRSLLPVRNKFSHKGDFGKTLIIAGSRGKMGAAVMCSRACLRTGAGLLTVHVPGCGYSIIQIAAPEAMATVDSSERHFSECPNLETYDTVGIGPGLGVDKQTIAAFRRALEQIDYPIVIDADGLNMLALEPGLLNLAPENSIFTPHPKEFERLAGAASDDFDRLEKQRLFAMDRRVIVVLKGAHTSVAAPDGSVYFNTTGNPGMATAGSGDALTGMITALLGQTKDPLTAAAAGVYLHGLAGDSAAMIHGQESLTASDIIDHIGDAFQTVRR